MNQLDRMERKLNRIGNFVLLICALAALIVGLEMQRFSDDFFFGYGRIAGWTFIAVIVVVAVISRQPFRD